MQRINSNFRAIVLTAFLALAAAPSWPQGASTQASAPARMVIERHERIALPALAQAAPPAEGARTPGAKAAPQIMSFVAYGRTFALELEPNERLLRALPSAQQQRLTLKAKLLRGKLSALPNSWVRLNEVGGRLSGAIWDGADLYLLDDSTELVQALGAAAQGDAPYTLIYRLKDMKWINAQCALQTTAPAQADFGALVKELAQALPAATRELSLAIVADTQFVQANSADPEAAVLARMNVVDGIYSEQLGVQLKVAQLRALQSNATLTSTNAGTLLDQFQDYAGAAGFVNPGLAHLFTGRNLDGSTVGIAYLSALCSTRFGVGLSETRGTGSAGALIVAHELGHNFGAPHDNQSGSACASTPNGFIMNPSINGSTSFSACSLSQMRPEIDAAACIRPITAASAEVRPLLPVNPINAAVGTSFTYRVEVNNSGTGQANSVSATIGVPNGVQLQSSSTSAGTCTNSATQVACALGSVPANTTRVITLTLRAPSAGRYLSNVAVNAANDSNSANNSAQAVINIGGGGLFEAHFDTGTDGFGYLDDAFRGTRQPNFALGGRVATGGFSGGALRVGLGGMNGALITGMSGGWRRSFTLPAQQRVRVALRVRVEQSATYESNEVTQALLSIDARLVGASAAQDYLVQVRGDGNAGSAITSGWQQFTLDLGVLNAGTHSLVIGGYNNQKDAYSERSSVFIDDLVVTAE